jgi:hypothetical protein
MKIDIFEHFNRFCQCLVGFAELTVYFFQSGIVSF